MRLTVNDSGSRFVIRSWSGDRRAQSVSITGVEGSTEYSVHASNMGVSVCRFPLIDRETAGAEFPPFPNVLGHLA